MDKSNNLLLFAAIVVVGIGLVNLGVTFSKATDFNRLVGFVTETGEANLTIESTVQINFTTASINWGSGKVDSDQTEAYLDTLTGAVTNGNWTANSVGLILENLGNVNVTLNMSTSNDASGFVGGTSPNYDWYFDDKSGESGSCANATGISGGWQAFSDVSTSEVTICDAFRFEQGNDELQIHINVTVPENSLKGARGSIITARATAI